MTRATALLRSLTFAWLMLCVAGSGAASFAVPAADRDVEVETSAELFLCRESAGADGGPRHRVRSLPAVGAVESRGGRDFAAGCAPARCALRSFPSLRASEMRIQV
jgi:hypothetical protein